MVTFLRDKLHRAKTIAQALLGRRSDPQEATDMANTDIVDNVEPTNGSGGGSATASLKRASPHDGRDADENGSRKKSRDDTQTTDPGPS